MTQYSPQPPHLFQNGESHHLPANPFNPHCWITGEPKIGDNVWVGAFTLLDGQGGLSIGKGVNISCGAAILTHSSMKRCVTEGRYGEVERQPVTIGDYVFIGENAIVLMGASIGHHSVIGAGAVVLENTVIPPYSMVVGVPGRVIRQLEEDAHQWARDYEDHNEVTAIEN